MGGLGEINIYTSHSSKERKGRKRTGKKGRNQRGERSRVNSERRRKSEGSL